MSLGQIAVLAATALIRLATKPDRGLHSVAWKLKDDIRTQRSEYGVPIPMLWGTHRFAGNVIWLGRVLHELDGKYYATLAIGICQGPVNKLQRIWADNELIYDNRAGATSVVQMDGLSFNFHEGTDTQEPDILMEAYYVGQDDEPYWPPPPSGNVPAYRDLCYIVLQDFPLEKFNNTIPVFEFEISTDATLTATWAEIDDIIADDEDDRDNMVFARDNLHVFVASDTHWWKVNTLTREVQLERDHTNPLIPLNNCGFDIDESGNIHTVKSCLNSYGVITILDGDTLEEIADGTDTVHKPQRVRVSKNTAHPYLVIVQGDSDADLLYVTHRYAYTLGGSAKVEIAAPAGTWRAVSLDDDNGVIWALAKVDSPAATWVCKITMSSDGTYTLEQWNVSSYVTNGDDIMFDADSDRVVVASSTDLKLAVFDATSMEHVETFETSAMAWYIKSALQRGAVGGYLYFVEYSTVDDGPTVIRLTMSTGVQDDAWDLDESGFALTGGGGGCYCSLTHAMVMAYPFDSSTDYVKFYLNRGQATQVQVSDIVADICAAAGLGVADVDVTELEELLAFGYVLVDRMTARDALEPLALAYLFDCIDTGGQLVFRVRGTDAVVDIPGEDLCAHVFGSERPQALVSTRQQELELPSVLEIQYFDRDANYETGMQRDRRLITQSREVRTLQLPLAMDADTAKQLAVKCLAIVWAERTHHQLSLSRTYAYLDPGDVVTITESNATHTLRIEKIDYSGGLLNIEAVSQSTSAYESDAPGVPTPIDEDEVVYPGPTTLRLIDAPLWDTSNNECGLYLATMGKTSAWVGAYVLMSQDGTWWNFDTAQVCENDSVMGKTTDVLADVFDPWIWDEGGSVNVRLLDAADVLDSATESEVLAGANLALLGDEIIQYRDATLEADGTYTLSGLLRGRKGSEWATGTHVAGELFVPLSLSNVTFYDLAVDHLGVLRYYRAYSRNQSQAKTDLSFTCYMRNMKPYAPQCVTGLRDGSDNLTISWIRRTRLGGEWLDGGDASLGETTESYSIDIYDGSDIVRTLTSSSQSVTYTAAQQTEDFGSPQAEVDVEVFQLSSVVGRGFGTSATV